MTSGSLRERKTTKFYDNSLKQWNKKAQILRKRLSDIEEQTLKDALAENYETAMDLKPIPSVPLAPSSDFLV